MMLQIVLCAVLAASFAAAQVTVTPDFDKVLAEESSGSFSYKCQNGDSSSLVYPTWTNEDGEVIQTSSGGGNERVYTTQSIEPGAQGNLYVTRLSFQNVKITEDGLYTCAIGADYEERRIIVTIPISFPMMEAEQSQRMLIERNGRVECTINSNPFPAVYWRINGQSIDNTNTEDRYTVTTQAITEPDRPGFEHAEIAILEVQDVVAQDTGSYECFATIDSTGDSLTLTIAVLVQVPPEWTVAPTDVQAVEGGSVTIQCAASGTPDPTYTWTNQAGETIVPVEGKYELVDDGEFFTVLNLDATDDQIYTCTASNDAINSTFTTEISQPMRLEVLIPPALNAQNNQTMMEGDDFSMDCVITRSDATGVLTWRRYGITEDDIVKEGTWNFDSRVTVTRKDEGRTLTLTLSPSNYDHSGGWTCFAESDAGNAYVTHYLSVESIPFIDRSETPSRVLSWPANPVNMSCVINGFPTPVIRWYVLQYERFVRVNVTENILFLADQPKGTSVMSIVPTEADFIPYYCEGTNSHGDVRERIELVEGAFPSEPENVRLTDVTSSTIRVLYDEPENDGGFDILNYVVVYNSGSDSLNVSRQYDNITNVVLDGLAGNTRYQVWVAAANDRGVGTYSIGKYTTTEPTSVPDEPRITSSIESEYAEKYVLTWEPPQNNGGSAITEYYIEYAQVDGPDDSELGSRPADAFEVRHTETEATLQPLNENKYYFVELRAINSEGRSLPAQLNFKTRGGFTFPSEEPKRPEQLVGEFGTTEIVAIVVACFIILLILIDVCCFCMNDCGVLMFICVNCCGKSAPSSKDEIEMGEEEYGGTKPSSPPGGDGPPTYQPMENGKPDDIEAPAPEMTPAAEAEPLMNKDGSDMNSNVGMDSPIVGKGESGQGEGLVVDNVTVELETSPEVNKPNDQQHDLYDDDDDSFRYSDKKPGATDC